MSKINVQVATEAGLVANLDPNDEVHEVFSIMSHLSG